MTNVEISKLDIDNATIQSFISDITFGRTNFQLLMQIQVHLGMGSLENITQSANRLFQENFAIVEEDMKRLVPQSQFINYPKN